MHSSRPPPPPSPPHPNTQQLMQSERHPGRRDQARDACLSKLSMEGRRPPPSHLSRHGTRNTTVAGNSLTVLKTRIEKALNILSEINSDLKSRGKVFVRKVASFVRWIISMTIVIGHVSLIKTKSLSVD